MTKYLISAVNGTAQAPRIACTHSVNGDGELSHGVESVGASVDELLNKLGELGTSSPLLGEALDLLFGGDLTGDEEPEETFRKGLRTTGSSGELGLNLGDSEISESDTLIGVKDGTLPDEALKK